MFPQPVEFIFVITLKDECFVLMENTGGINITILSIAEQIECTCSHPYVFVGWSLLLLCTDLCLPMKWINCPSDLFIITAFSRSTLRGGGGKIREEDEKARDEHVVPFLAKGKCLGGCAGFGPPLRVLVSVDQHGGSPMVCLNGRLGNVDLRNKLNESGNTKRTCNA